MERFKLLRKNRIANLPKTSGVYLFRNGKETIYIGKAINIRDRVKNHFSGNNWWEKTLLQTQGVPRFGGQVGYLETNSEIEALVLEANLIKKYQPKFNVVWRDDKNYFYVAAAKNKNGAPYIFITHQPFGAAQGKKNEKTEYIGPFVEGTALKKTLRFLRRVFPYYTAMTHPANKCAWCHLGLCPGPRLFEARLASSKNEAANLIVEYKKNIKKLVLILKGKRNAVLNSLKKEMRQLSKEKKFEEAAKIRDRISNLQQVMSHTHIIESARNLVKSDLTKFLRVRPINRIECYDVSNIQGKFATGSMVVFIGGKPARNFYRKFKIKSGDEPNDIAMLKEIIERRLSHEEWRYPEIMLIDGGIAQLNIAIKTKNGKAETKDIKIISIAKGRRELFIEGRSEPIPLKNLPQDIYNLIKLLDDEAHRFAITYHRKLRKNGLLN